MFSTYGRRLARLAVVSCALASSSSAPAAEPDRHPFTLRRPAAAPDPSALAAGKRREAVARLEVLLGQTAAGSPLRAAMMLRLADLYDQEGRARYAAEMERCGDAVDCDHADSVAWRERALGLYADLVETWPRDAHADEATFLLGSLLDDLGRRPQAAGVYRRLVKLYPGSDFSADAFLQLGEYAFDVEEDAAAALVAYQHAAAVPGFAKAGYARYRAAWCAYNLGDLDGAIALLERVYAESTDPSAPGASLSLGDQALDDLVMFFADAERPDEAEAYFTRIGQQDRVPDVLARVAARLDAHGQVDGAVAVWRELAGRDPAGAVDHELAAARALDRAGRREDVARELAALRALAAPGSAWSIGNADRAGAAVDAIEELHRAVALRWFQRARQLDKAHQREAEGWYVGARDLLGAWLDAWSDRAGVDEVRYHQAEILYRLGDFPAAYAAYTAVVDHDPSGPRAAFCAESAVHAAEEAVRREGGDLVPKRPTPARDTPPLPLTTWEQRFVDAAQRFAAQYPGPGAKDALYRAAYLLYARFRFAEASGLFERVVALDPRSPEARLSVELLLDALAIREDWDTLARSASAFAAQANLGDAAFRAELSELAERAAFKRVDAAFAADRDDAAAGAGYQAFADAHPGSRLASQALHNAAVHWAAAGRLAEAMAARERIVAAGPADEHFREQVGRLGADRERVADYAGAADLYERRWALPPRDETSADALFAAAALRGALGDAAAAVRDADVFVAAYPADPRSADLAARAVRWAGASGGDAEALRRLRALDRAPLVAETAEHRAWVRVRLAEALAAAGANAEADAAVARLEADTPADASPERLELLAEARMGRAERQIARWRALALTGLDPAASKTAQDRFLRDRLAAERRGLEAVEQSLTAVVDTRSGPWGLAATVALGESYAELAADLRASDRPTWLTPEQLDDYERGIEDHAYLLDEKARSAYTAVVARASELGLYGPASEAALAHLGAVDPEEGAPERMPEPRWVDAPDGRSFPLATAL